jgi:hypothetical protein
VTAISSTSQTSSLQITFQQIKNDWQSLAKSLQSGDLATAQKAFASLQDDQQTMGPPPGGDNSQISSDFDALSSALKSGDLDAAQKAFSTLQTDMQAMKPPPGQGPGGPGGPGGQDGGGSGSSSSSQSSGAKTIANETTQTNPNGTITITYTYTDGSTSTVTQQAPVSSTSALDSSNTAQLQTLLNAQEASQQA